MSSILGVFPAPVLVSKFIGDPHGHQPIKNIPEIQLKMYLIAKTFQSNLCATNLGSHSKADELGFCNY